MISAGCDVGSLTAEAVILENSSILSSKIIRVRPIPEESAKSVMDEALLQAELSYADIGFCISTGYGRGKISFADANISEISCHGRGAQWLLPDVRTVIDIGGQDCKVIQVNDKGELVDFIMNDKCAAGTGRFLEVMGSVLGVGMEGLAPLAFESKNSATITNMCSIFAEREVITAIHEGEEPSDIASGICKAMAKRVKVFAKKIGIKPEVTITGGVAKNEAVKTYLEEELGIKTKELPEDSQIVGALGAALFAREKLEGNR